MQTERWQLIEDLFHAALDLPAFQREAFLLSRTSEPELVAQVENLLAAHESSHTLLDAPSPSTLPKGTRLGPYELLSILGSGGMGTVYLARRADGQYDKHVAIKLTNQGLAELAAGSRFERERQILANLEHPHIARLLDAGLSQHGQPYLVMELVEGTTLDVWMAKRKPSLNVAIDLWEKVASAVAYAHRTLCVHRDIKPSNILVAADDWPKLVDFGIARPIDEASGSTQTLKLTPRYASPEQIRNLPVTTATDIYNLGVILFELATGRHPFPEANLDPLASRIPKFPPGFDTDLAAVIGMALRPEPERRYPTVDQFLEDVKRFRRGFPVVAQPETRSYQLRKYVLRHRWGVFAASAAVICLIAITAVAVIQARRAATQLARANKVSEFISGIMGILPDNAPSTLRSKGASLRVVDLVDSVSARMDRDLTNQPEAEATIRYLAASAYNQMGLYEKARPLAARAVVLFSTQRTPDDQDRVAAEILLGLVHMYLGEFQQAEQVLSETRTHWKNPAPYTIAGLESVLGIAQLRLGQRDAAEQTFKHCLQAMESGLGADNPWIGLVLSNLSLVYQERGEFDRARDVLQKAVSLTRARRSEAPDGLGWAALNLAQVERILNRPLAAKASALESIDAFRDALGESSPPAAQSMAQLAWAKARLDEPDAEEWARKAVSIEREKLPLGHSEQAVGLTWLGFVLLHKNRPSEARPLLEQALEIRRKSFPAQDWHTVPAAGFLGEALVREGETERGLTVLREIVKALTTQFGPANVRTNDAQQRLARYE